MADLICVVPDSPYRGLIEALSRCHNELGIGHFSISVYTHTGKDPGVYKDGSFVARAQRGRPPLQARYGLLLLDHEGNNSKRSSVQVEEKLESDLGKVTFSGCACAVCFDPELEAIFLQQPRSLSRVLDAPEHLILRWIEQAEAMHPSGMYEERMQWVLRMNRKRTHDKVSFREVVDNTDYGNWTTPGNHPYTKLITTLRIWFPPAT